MPLQTMIYSACSDSDSEHADESESRSLDIPVVSISPSQETEKTHLSMNFLWNSDLKRSLTNSPFFLSSSVVAWFLKIKSSSHLLWTANVGAADEREDGLAESGVWPNAAWRLSSGFPVAISASRSR